MVQHNFVKSVQIRTGKNSIFGQFSRSGKYGIDKSVLMGWKGKVIDKVDKKITLSNNTSSKFHNSVLQQNNPLNTLNDLESVYFHSNS